MIQTQCDNIGAIDSIYEEIVDIFTALDEITYLYAPPHKWTSGQRVQCLIIALRPMAEVLSLHKFTIKLKLGQANRPSRSYDSVYNKYLKGLHNGYQAPDIVTPWEQPHDRRDMFLKSFKNVSIQLSKATNKWSETQLDDYILPHLAMGQNAYTRDHISHEISYSVPSKYH